MWKIPMKPFATQKLSELFEIKCYDWVVQHAAQRPRV
jgi:hypothetical protein